ncbi:ATPase H(+)-transporting accessory protein 2 isoform X2 [Vespa crabro]|uniref:ATPase H(+)-transporting accessory protein 2 isoform X2 n=1 Tax=Vespa crabro TaxID=7445 RepID=UPI001F004855|nr:ATPase H(+)-transporting accessory protein 2 isoform X2 [Vespa crabro]
MKILKEMMLNLFICFVFTLAGVYANGEFVVLHSPDSVSFHGNEKILQSLLKEIFTASLGFTIKQKGTWEGISIRDPFSLPEAIVSIAVEGVDKLDVPNGKKFQLNDDEIEETTWQAISGRLAERDNDNTLVRIYLGDGLDALGQSALGELKPVPIDESSLKALRLTNEEDQKFLEEIQLLHAIAKKVPTAIKADDKPDVYWLVVSGLRPVLDLHGKNSTAAKEALLLLNNAFNGISEAFTKAYDDKVVITAFTNDASLVRHTRSISSDRQRREAQDDRHKNVVSMVESSNTEFNSNNIIKKQADQEEENRNISDEENIEINIHSTSEINSDVSSTTEYSDTNADSGSTEKSEQDLAKMENKINTNTKSVGQPADQEDKSRNINEEENINISIHSASKINTNISSTTEYNDVNTNSGNTEKSDQELTNTENQINVNTNNDEWNHAKYYTYNYPVIFNIFLWFGVVFVFSLLAICIAIADMDPGRDSIIYRMTSNRMKKDN